MSVDDADAALDRLRDGTDTEVVTGPTTIEALDVYVVFVTDPDGYLVELVEEVD